MRPMRPAVWRQAALLFLMFNILSCDSSNLQEEKTLARARRGLQEAHLAQERAGSLADAVAANVAVALDGSPGDSAANGGDSAGSRTLVFRVAKFRRTLSQWGAARRPPPSPPVYATRNSPAMIRAPWAPGIPSAPRTPPRAPPPLVPPPPSDPPPPNAPPPSTPTPPRRLNKPPPPHWPPPPSPPSSSSPPPPRAPPPPGRPTPPRASPPPKRNRSPPPPPASARAPSPRPPSPLPPAPPPPSPPLPSPRPPSPPPPFPRPPSPPPPSTPPPSPPPPLPRPPLSPLPLLRAPPLSLPPPLPQPPKPSPRPPPPASKPPPLLPPLQPDVAELPRTDQTGAYVMTSIVLGVDMCGQESSINQTLIEDLWANVLPSYFETVSFGLMTMPSASNVVRRERIKIGCSGWTSYYWDSPTPTENNLEAWGVVADSAAAKLGIPLSPYFHRVLVMPSSMGGVSFAHINCPRTYLSAVRVWSGVTVGPEQMLRTYAHELGHNLGLLHSKGYDSDGNGPYEYGDASCPMGTVNAEGSVHYNAPNSVWLNWTMPQAVLRANYLAAGVWRTFNLVGLADSRISSLQIFPGSWMPAASDGSGWNADDKLYISFRRHTPDNGDRGLLPQYRNKVQVHRHGNGSSPCASPHLLATLDAIEGTTASSWPDRTSSAPAHTQAPLLVVQVERIDAAGGRATVRLCRATQFTPEFGSQCGDGLDNDCDGKVDNC